MHKLMRPKFVNWVFDELNEGDEQAPRVRPVHDESLEQHPGDLLLHGLGVGLREQVQQAAREVVRVAVRVAELVRDRVQEQVPGNTRQHCTPEYGWSRPCPHTNINQHAIQRSI